MTVRPSSLLVCLCLAASPSVAEVATVKGGEHPDFTRIVIEAPGEDGWRFGRRDDGYELSLSGRITGYDLSVAFDRIPKDRVSGLWRDPDTGRLRLALSCPCHAIAFEFRPGIIVVDVKPGPPPAGSAFELSLDGMEAPAPAGAAPPDTAALAPPDQDTPGAGATRGALPDDGSPRYDWLAIRREGEADTPYTGIAPDLGAMSVAAALGPLQEALLQQISRGAVEGIVQIAEHPVLPSPAGPGPAEAEGMRVALGELPGLVIGNPRQPGAGLAADGTRCIPDARLQLQSWSMPGSVAEQLGPGRSGLLTEFDAPVPPAILRAARAYLAIGFGAEARQFLALLQGEAEEEAALLEDMSHIVDLGPPPRNAFAGMESCDGAAALWATLAAAVTGSEAVAALRNLDSNAVARSFSGLSPQQRQHFAPVLVDAFLGLGDEETARRLRDATLRPPGPANPEIDLMGARYDLATGDAEAAGRAADDVMAEAGPQTARAAVTLVDAAFAGSQSLSADLPEKLSAFLREARGTELEAPLRRALVLGSAMAGDYAGAFAALPGTPQTARDLWVLAARAAGDDVFFEQAIATARRPAVERPTVDPATGLAVAERLMSLGFAADALTWLGPLAEDAEAQSRVLAARANLSLRDARAALVVLSGLGDPEAERLRAEAMLQLGDPMAAADAYDRAGDAAARDRARVWARDWPLLAEAGPDLWVAAAALVAPPDPEGGPVEDAGPGDATDAAAADAPAGQGPLSQGAAMVEDSAAAREAIEGLLLSIATTPDS